MFFASVDQETIVEENLRKPLSVYQAVDLCDVLIGDQLRVRKIDASAQLHNSPFN